MSRVAVRSAVGLLVAVGAVLPVLGLPAEPPEIERFESVLTRSDSLFVQRKPDSALALLVPILEESRSRGDSVLRLSVLLRQARVLGTVGRPSPAEHAAREAFAIASETGDTTSLCRALRWLSVATEQQGRMEEAAGHARRLLELALHRGDREHEAHARLVLAYADLLSGDLEAAREGYERAISLFQQIGNRRFELIARTGLGRTLHSLGEIDAARSFFLQVVEGSRQIGDPFGEAHGLNNLGGIEFVRGDPAAAVERYRRAFELHLSNGNPEGCIVPLTNLAIAQTYMGDLEDAVAVLRQADRICSEHHYAAQRATVLGQLAIVRREQGRIEDAANLFREGVRVRPAVPVETRARMLIGLAKTLSRMDSVVAALEVLETEVEPLRERTPPLISLEGDRLRGELLLHLGRAREAHGAFLRAESVAEPLGIGYRAGPLALAARCLVLLGEPDSALSTLERAAGVWEGERARSRDPIWREQLGADARLLCTSLVERLLEKPQECPSDSNVRAAFDAAQRFKARTLRERIAGPAGFGAETLIGTAGPAVTVAEVQESVLKEGELLLDSFVGPERSFLFAVTQTDCRVFPIVWEQDGLDERLRRYRRLLSEPPSPDDRPDDLRFLEEVGRRLSGELLAPAAEMIRCCDRILFSPDESLNLIPLSVWSLPDSAGDGGDVLLRTHEIVRVPSSTLLAELRGHVERCAVAAADVRTVALWGVAGEPCGLPGAQKEVAWLSHRFRNVDARVMEREGTGSALVRDLEHCQILHLAAHMRADDTHPWRSGILASGDGGIEGEVLLPASEIASLQLPVRLAVLSGCESAGGRILSGEGVLGLAAAFVAAGVPAVVATLWPVSDRVTVRMMREFYGRLGEGMTAAAALRGAQLSVRETAGTEHPFYWAGFVLVGEGEVRVRLETRRGFRGLLVVAALLGSALGLFLLLRGGRSPSPGEVPQ